MNALRDPEVVELFSDEPELLALADAVGATQQRPRRVPKRALALAATFAVAAVIALLAPWGERGPDVVDRALAALGPGAVLHAVVLYSAEDAIVDLETGRSTPRVHRTEYWYDAARSMLRAKLSTDGVRVSEVVATPRGGVSDIGRWTNGPAGAVLDPLLAEFATGYRQALEGGHAREVGRTTIDGRDAVVLEIERSKSETTTVIVDDETYRPLQFYSTYAGGRRSPTLTVVEMETLRREPSQFADPAPSRVRPTTGTGTDWEPVTFDEAERELGTRPLWLGGRFVGSSYPVVGRSRMTVTLSDGRTLAGAVVHLRYGRIDVVMAREPDAEFILGVDMGEPMPPAGSIAVTHDWGGPRHWAGKLRAHGFWISIVAPTREDLLDAARSIEPAP